MHKLFLRLFLTSIVIAGLAMISCQGLHTPRDDGPSTAYFRTTFEMISNAELVQEDTSPQWLHGRYAFRRGSDRLLVISRITSFADRPGESTPRDKKEIPGRRYDRYLERVWITVPFGTGAGHELRMEDLEKRFLIGYDEGGIAEGVFTQPHRLLGFVSILEERPESILIQVNVRVAPQRRASWDIQETIEVPITTTGIYAHEATGRIIPIPSRDMSAFLAPPPAPLMPQPETPVPGEELPEEPLQEPDLQVDRPITGMWVGNIRQWEYRLQFDDNGHFIISANRGNAPMVHEGTYEVKQNYLVLRYERYYEYKDTGKLDHSQYLTERIIALRIDWKNDDLVLEGQLQNAQVSGPYRFTRSSETLPAMGDTDSG